MSRRLYDNTKLQIKNLLLKFFMSFSMEFTVFANFANSVLIQFN